MPPQPTDSSSANAGSPFLSVVIPMYNRAQLVGRTLESCLSQDFKDCEIIVVDDRSEDGSAKVVEGYTRKHPNVRLVLSPRNQGLCPTRGLGAAHARGKWITFIDSDDTFHPGAFDLIRSEANAAPREVSEVRFCCYNEELDAVTPDPLMPEGIIGFPEYLRWLDEATTSDIVYCHRREVYQQVQWPADRRSAAFFFLQLASRFNMKMVPRVIVTKHNDAPNRNTDAMGNKAALDPRWLQRAHDDAIGYRQAKAQFGDQMKRYCPRFYRWLDFTIATSFFRAGYRVKGCAHMLRQLTRHPLSGRAWVWLILGLMGPRAVHLGRAARKRVAPRRSRDAWNRHMHVSVR